jgi:hypothetical protein
MCWQIKQIYGSSVPANQTNILCLVDSGNYNQINHKEQTIDYDWIIQLHFMILPADYRG